MWWPLDNSPKLLKEVAHESQATFGVHGTPAGGAGVPGWLSIGMQQVLLLCKDQQHADQLKSCIKQRLAEDYVTKGSFFCNELANIRASRFFSVGKNQKQQQVHASGDAADADADKKKKEKQIASGADSEKASDKDRGDKDRDRHRESTSGRQGERKRTREDRGDGKEDQASLKREASRKRTRK